jgi:hypothetical protein
MADARGLLCPFPTTPSHPEAEALTQSTLSWARAWRLLPDESARTLASVHSYSQLAARCYPTAAFPRLAAICDYYSWLFFFDDVCEDVSIDGGDPRHVVELLSDVYGVMLGKPEAPTVHPMFQGALADIWARIAPFSPPTWQTRLKRHVENYIDGCAWEAQNRRLGRVPSRAVFEAMRMHTSTMYEFWDFMEFAADFYLPDEVLEQPLVAELRRTGNAIASFANDIFSLRKETQNRDIHNLVIVLEHEEELPREAALDRAASLHDAQVRHFIEIEARLPSFGSELDQALQRYAHGMRIWIRANYDWSTVTPRYNEALARSA